MGRTDDLSRTKNHGTSGQNNLTQKHNQQSNKEVELSSATTVVREEHLKQCSEIETEMF